MGGRDWGYWTEQKLEMLREYLPRFTQASKKAKVTVYLDLFAGVPENVSRTTQLPIDGSPRIALSTVPQFTRVRLFELPGKAAQLQTSLQSEHPGRDLKVWPGDCNELIDKALAELSDVRWAPAFAFVDQQAAEIAWATLTKLAKFKKPGRPKVEQWILFAPSMLPRGLSTVTEKAVLEFTERIDAMFGSHAWYPVYAARLRDEISGQEFRDELTNLMRWQLERQLGYKRTHSFEMKNTNGTPLYSMIFATDHEAGDKIMAHIYAQAAKKRPQMQAAARAKADEIKEQSKPQQGLFPRPPRPAKDEPLYTHQPPTPPRNWAS